MTKKSCGSYTMADIAKKVGVSPTAVSMALRNTDGVSEILREKIRKVANEMHYSPTLAARMLRSKHTGQLGLYLPVSGVEKLVDSRGFVSPVMAHFVNQCEASKYSYHIELEGGNGTTFKPPSQLTGKIVDGVLLAGEICPELRKWLDHSPEYKWVNILERAEYCILSDNHSGIYRAVEHLAAMGHQRIAFAHCDREYDVHATAVSGYHDAINDFKLCTDEFLCKEFKTQKSIFSFDIIVDWAESILTATNRPTAIICNDQKIVSVLTYISAQRGIKIPEQLSLIAYGTRSQSEHQYPLITTIEADFHTILEKGIQMLIKRINNQIIDQKQIMVEPRLLKYSSVAPVSGK